MKRFTALAAAALVIVGLAGCSSSAAEVTPGNKLTNIDGYDSGYVETPRGKVFCIESPRYDLSCDWDNIAAN